MSFTAQITANVDGFSKAIDQAAKEIDGLQKTVEQRLSSLGDSFLSVGKKASVFSAGVAAAATGLFAFAKNTGDMANNLLSATIALDSSADILQEYKLVSIEAGTSADAFSRSVEALTRRLKDAGEESDNISKYIKTLGVSLFDASGNMRRTGDITNDIIKSLAQMENVSQRNVIASQLFGRAWVGIAPILDLGADGIDNIRQNAHDLGIVLNGDALNSANNFSVSVNKMGLQLRAIKDNLASEIAPLLSDTIVPIIEERVIPAISSMAGRIGDLVKSFNELPQGTKEAIMAITGVAAAIGPALVGLGGLLKILPLIGTAVTTLTGPVGLVVAAIAGAAALIISNWDEIKAYFTTGGGAEMFNTVKELAQTLWADLKRTFEDIKRVVVYVWDSLGSDVVNIIKNAVNIIATVVETIVKTFRNVIQVLDGLFRLDFKTVLDGLKNLFVDIFSGISRIVLNGVSSISSALAGMFDLIGLDKWAGGLRGFSERITSSMKTAVVETEEATEAVEEQTTAIKELATETQILAGAQADVFRDGSNVFDLVRRTSDEITVLTNRLKGLRDGTIAVKNVHAEIEKTEEKVKKLSTALDTLTGGRDLTINLKTPTGIQAWNESSLFKDINPVITPTIDTSLVQSGMGQLIDETKVLTLDIGNMLGGAITSAAAGIGEALANGENVMDEIGKTLIKTMGSLASQLGQQMIAFGMSGIALKKLMMNPYAAVAAGAALVALGSAASAAASKTMNSYTGGYSGGTSSYNNVTSPGASEYRGVYQDDFVVTFVQKGSDLVGVLNTAEQRRYRL